MRKTTKSPGEKIVKDIKRATRKHYSSEEKIRIVLDGLRKDWQMVMQPWVKSRGEWLLMQPLARRLASRSPSWQRRLVVALNRWCGASQRMNVPQLGCQGGGPQIRETDCFGVAGTIIRK